MARTLPDTPFLSSAGDFLLFLAPQPALPGPLDSPRPPLRPGRPESSHNVRKRSKPRPPAAARPRPPRAKWPRCGTACPGSPSIWSSENHPQGKEGGGACGCEGAVGPAGPARVHTGIHSVPGLPEGAVLVLGQGAGCRPFLRRRRPPRAAPAAFLRLRLPAPRLPAPRPCPGSWRVLRPRRHAPLLPRLEPALTVTPRGRAPLLPRSPPSGSDRVPPKRPLPPVTAPQLNQGQFGSLPGASPAPGPSCRPPARPPAGISLRGAFSPLRGRHARPQVQPQFHLPAGAAPHPPFPAQPLCRGAGSGRESRWPSRERGGQARGPAGEGPGPSSRPPPPSLLPHCDRGGSVCLE